MVFIFFFCDTRIKKSDSVATKNFVYGRRWLIAERFLALAPSSLSSLLFPRCVLCHSVVRLITCCILSKGSHSHFLPLNGLPVHISHDYNNREG